MVQCCVPFCKSRQESPGKKCSFHEFPVTNVRFEWLRRIARKAEGKQWVPSDRSKVCSRHFRQEDYRQDVKIRLLRPDAVPSIFPPPSSSGLVEGQARRKRCRPSTDSVPVDCRAPEPADEPAGPKTKALRVASAQRAAASTRAAGKKTASSQKPSQKSVASAMCFIVQPVSSPPKNPVGLPKTGPRKGRVPCSRSSSTGQAKASSLPVVFGATALNANEDASLPRRSRVPSTLPAAPSEPSPGSAKPVPPCRQPQAAPSTVPPYTSTPASQTNVVASQTGTSVFQTGTSSASQTNVPELQTCVSASQTSMPALQKNASASQTGTPSLQTSASARKTTSGALQPPPPKQVVRLVQLPNSPVIKGLLPPSMRSQVGIIVPGAAASKPLLVSLTSPPQVMATATTEPAKGDLPPVVHSTHSDVTKGQRGNATEPVKPLERHVRTWGSQTRLNRVRLRHMWQRFRTAQRKCLKLQADRQRLQTELAAACQKARQAQAFIKQLKLNRFQEGLSRRDPRCLFLEEQLRCLGQSKHRWREDTLQSCLHWHALAPRGYRLIAQSGLLALPSGSTLKRHLHGTTSATPRNPPSPTGDTLPDNIDWAQVDCNGDQESSGQRPANSDWPVTSQPVNEPHNVVEVGNSTEGVASSSESVVLGAKDGAETPARVDRASRETGTVCSDFNLAPASGQRPADTTDAESGLPQSVVEVVVSTEEVVSSSSMVLDNVDGAERLQVSQASQEARMACSDFNLVPAATLPSGQGHLRVIYVTVPTSHGEPFSTDSVLPSGIAVLPGNRGAVQPLVCSPSARTESPCSPSAEYVVQVESVTEEQTLEDNSPPKDLAELLNIVGVEPSQM